MSNGLLESFLYYPDRIEQDAPPPGWTPAGASEVWMRAGDGTLIHGLWWSEPADRPVILFLHGNAQEVYSWSLVRDDLAAARCRMLLIDYRGYGKSEGAPDEAGLYMDGHAALDWLSGQGTPPSRTVVFGKSLGGAVACEIARGTEMLGLALESTFTSLASVAGNLLPFARSSPDIAGAYDSLAKMPEISCPVLVIHGDADTLIPADEGRKLFEAANEPRELFVVRGAGHNDVSVVSGPEYGKRVSDWLENTCLGRTADGGNGG